MTVANGALIVSLMTGGNGALIVSLMTGGNGALVVSQVTGSCHLPDPTLFTHPLAFP